MVRSDENEQPIQNQDIKLELHDDITSKQNLAGASQALKEDKTELQIEETMAKLPHTERNSSSELEDGDSTDMGYASNDGEKVGCMACSPCCITKKTNIKQAK